MWFVLLGNDSHYTLHITTYSLACVAPHCWFETLSKYRYLRCWVFWNHLFMQHCMLEPYVLWVRLCSCKTCHLHLLCYAHELCLTYWLHPPRTTPGNAQLANKTKKHVDQGVLCWWQRLQPFNRWSCNCRQHVFFDAHQQCQGHRDVGATIGSLVG